MNKTNVLKYQIFVLMKIMNIYYIVIQNLLKQKYENKQIKKNKVCWIDMIYSEFIKSSMDLILQS